MADLIPYFLVIVGIYYGLTQITDGFQFPPKPIRPPHLQVPQFPQLDQNGFKNYRFQINKQFGSGGGPGGPRIVTWIQTQPDPNQGFTKSEIRNLPHPKDLIINLKGRPQLTVQYGQANKKLRDHGALYNLEFDLKSNGGTRTLKSEKNLEGFMKGMEDLLKDPSTVWIDQGTFQGGTERQVEAIHAYDPPKRVLILFNRVTGKFITTCGLSVEEQILLYETSNFLGVANVENFVSGQGKNLPPKQSLESGFTPVNTFESDVLGVTPIEPSVKSNFTPRNSFQSDVLGVTPITPDFTDF